MGTDSDHVNFAADRKKWIFVSKYKTSYSKEDRDQYLSTSFPNVSFLTEKVPNKGDFSSFRICVSEDNFQLMMDPSKWPK